MVLEMLFEEFQVVNFLNKPCQRNVKTRILSIYSTKMIKHSGYMSHLLVSGCNIAVQLSVHFSAACTCISVCPISHLCMA